MPEPEHSLVSIQSEVAFPADPLRGRAVFYWRLHALGLFWDPGLNCFDWRCCGQNRHQDLGGLCTRGRVGKYVFGLGNRRVCGPWGSSRGAGRGATLAFYCGNQDRSDCRIANRWCLWRLLGTGVIAKGQNWNARS